MPKRTHNLKISLIHGDLLTTSCSIVFLKHVEGKMCNPEKAIDTKTEGLLRSQFEGKEQDDCININLKNRMPFHTLCVINFHTKDLPFRYSSVDTYARKIMQIATSRKGIAKVATAIHGPGAGLDASEAMETMLLAFASELQSKGQPGDLQEIMFIEKDKVVFERLQERIKYISSNKGIIFFKGEDIYLKPASVNNVARSEKDRVVRLAAKPLFVAMPYAREFNNIYYFGIKEPIEQRGRVCERVDQDKFVGDIVDRIKERINNAELVIADITGHNPNVFYEVGYAEGLGKKVIFITQKQDIPFDLRTQKQINYDPQDILSLANQLGELLDAILMSSCQRRA